MMDVWGSKRKARPQCGGNQGRPNFVVQPIVLVLLAPLSSATHGKQWILLD